MWPDEVSNPGPLALETDALLGPVYGENEETKIRIPKHLIPTRGKITSFDFPNIFPL